MGMEVAEGAAHDDLVAGLQREDVAAGDARVHLHETALVGLERWRGNAHGEHEHVALGGIVGHGVGTDGGLGVLALQVEHLEFLPAGHILGTNELAVVVVVVDAVEGWNLDLSIRARDEVHVLARRQLHLKLLDKRGHVLVADDGALVLLHAEDALVNVDAHIALHLALAPQSPVGFDLLAGEVGLLRVEDLSPTLQHLHLALSAAGLSTACRGQEDAALVECGHEVVALRHVEHLVAIHRDVHIAAGREIVLSHQQDDDNGNDCHQEN